MRILFLVVALTACSSPEEALDLGPADAAPQAPFAGPLSLAVKTQLDWAGAPGEGPIESAHFEDGIGSLVYVGTSVPAVVYRKIPFPGFPYTLAAIAGTTHDGLVVAFAYCTDGGISRWFSESLTQGVLDQGTPASAGSCAFVDEPSDLTVAFTRPSAQLVYAPLTDRASVHGPGIDIEGGAGRLAVDGIDYALSVFTTVDCSACGGAGWEELHVSLTKDETLAFTIVYLLADKPAVVQLGYGIRFDQPGLWPADGVQPATWALK